VVNACFCIVFFGFVCKVVVYYGLYVVSSIGGVFFFVVCGF
jgi:hypothetical protein